MHLHSGAVVFLCGILGRPDRTSPTLGRGFVREPAAQEQLPVRLTVLLLLRGYRMSDRSVAKIYGGSA